MNRRKVGPSLYFASDKVIFDALNHRSVKMEVIRDLLFERGIIVSTKTPKLDLAHYFSRLTTDYFDQRNIGLKLGRVAKHERMTFAEIDGTLKQADVLNALNTVKASLEGLQNRVAISQPDDGRLIAIVSYEHVDYTEVEFRQVQPRDLVIEFVPEGADKYFVRSTKNTFADAILDEVFSAMKANVGHELPRSSVGLEGYADPSVRTKFFESLMHGIAGHDFVTVTEAFCFKPKVAATIKEDEESDEEPPDLEKQPYVERVGLKGSGVNKTFVIDELYAKGYYIIKVVWRVKSKASIDSDVFELEAQFSEPQTCTGFSYQVRCAYLNENGKITDKKRSAKLSEQDAIFRLIEAAAKTAMSKAGEP
jgi:hypothetical protein